MKIQNIIIVLLILAIGYLFYQNTQLKNDIDFNREIIEGHQYSIDLRMKQVQDLHGITNQIIQKTGVDVDNVITTDPYNK